jgi:hypothetical protein
MLRLLFLFIIISATCQAQTRLSRSVNDLTVFIASDYFALLHERTGDLALVDTIYIHALELTGSDHYDALLTATFTAIPYNKIPIVFPLLHFKINAMLPCMPDSVYLKKNAHLPKSLLFDSPKDDFGDKDKIAHFFGNALLGYALYLFDISKFFGIFVEEFESAFEVQNSVDKRDLLVNKLGYAFGQSLREDKSRMPSEFFLLNTIKYLRFTL